MSTKQVSDFPQVTSASGEDFLHLKTEFGVDNKLKIKDFLNSQSITKNFDTVADMKASSEVQEGMVVQTAERSSGNGGGGTFDAVLTSTVTPNGDDIIQSTADPTISFVMRDVPAEYYVESDADLIATDLIPRQIAVTNTSLNIDAEDTLNGKKRRIVKAVDYTGSPDETDDLTLSNGNIAKRIRGVPTNIDFNVEAVDSAYFLRYRTVSESLAVGNQTQGFACDDKNNVMYEVRGVSNPDNILISKYRLDSGIPQRSFEATAPIPNTDDRFGHQTLGVRVDNAGNVRLFIQSNKNGYVTSFDFVDSAQPANIIEYQLIPDATTLLDICVSYDQKYLIAREGTPRFRTSVFDIEQVIGGVFEPISTFHHESDAEALQGFCEYNGVVYSIYGLAQLTPNKVIKAHDWRTGELLANNQDVTLGLSDATNSGAGTFWEPEGLSISKAGIYEEPKLIVNILSGDIARRATRYYVTDVKPFNLAEYYANRAFAACPTFITNQDKSTVINFIGNMIEANLWNKMGLFYLFALDNEDLARINLCHPFDHTLEDVGMGATHTPGLGFVGLGSGNYLRTNAHCGRIQNHDRDRCSIGTRIEAWDSGGGGTGVVMGVQGGTLTFMEPRNNAAGDFWKSRMFDSAALKDTANNTALASFIQSRLDDTYYKYRNKTSLDTIVEPFVTSSDASDHILCFFRSGSGLGSDSTLSYGFAGLYLTSDEVSDLLDVLDAYRTDVGII